MNHEPRRIPWWNLLLVVIEMVYWGILMTLVLVALDGRFNSWGLMAVVAVTLGIGHLLALLTVGLIAGWTGHGDPDDNPTGAEPPGSR